MKEEFNLEEYLELSKGLSKHFKLAKNFSQSNLNEYCILLQEFKDSFTSKSSDKGKKLEKLVEFIFDKSLIFEVYSNIYTSTNEIDHLISLSELGRKLSADKLFDIKGDYLLTECKNYDKRIDVTWLGKFCNLLEENPARIGILFSVKGFKGRGNWDSAKGLAKKFYYRKESYNEKMYVIDFNLKDFEKLGTGISIVDILDEKIKSIELDTNFEKYLKPHPGSK